MGTNLLPFDAARHHEPEGAVLIAGTGAVPALVNGLDIIRTTDGHGWLLRDEGSGTWLGLQALNQPHDGRPPYATRCSAQPA
jgi:N-acetylglucosamine kinase-like BadF-type ATPase